MYSNYRFRVFRFLVEFEFELDFEFEPEYKFISVNP